jgi:PAS domain S-box-containing protein
MCFDELLAESDHQNILPDLLNSVDRTRMWELSMIRRGGGTIDIKASSVALDHDSEKLVITFEPAALLEQREVEKDRQRQLWDGLQTLAVALLENGIEDALILALEACFVLTGSSAVAIYQAFGDKPALNRTYIIGANHLLPEDTPANDLAALQKPTLWTPGRRTEIELHRHARTNKVSYIASAPIGQVNASVGLIVAVSHHSEPTEEILEVLNFVGVLITSIIQEHTLLAHLQNTIKEHNSSLTEHELITGFIQNGIVILRKDLSIRDMNSFAEDTLGYTCKEVQGQSIDKILISADNIKTRIVDALGNNNPSQIDSTRLYRRNGQAFLANIQILPITETDGLSGVIIILRDLSEQEEYHTLNQQLEQRAMLGEVTASFAHEVRNPINNISTGLQLLAVSLPEDDINQEHVKRIKGDCDRLAALIKSSLTIVRPMDFKMKPVDIGSLIKFILDRLQARLVRANIQHNIQVEDDVPRVHGDFSALEHVFQNLIENAMQAMTLGGGTLSVKISLFQREGESKYVEINISDTGIGIPEEIRERIFEPFFTTKDDGTGLGLAIVKRIITAHKGVINMESIPGATVFQVRLPVAKTA